MNEHGREIMVVTLCTAASVGIFLTAICRRYRLPAIVALLGAGIGLGPEGLGIVRPDSLGEFLPVIVSLSIGLILFEGGLTLDLRGYLGGSRIIRRLLTIGVLVTWLLSAGFIWLIFRTSPGVAFLCGSLIIVSGPTVIVPLLKRIQVTARLHHILHWEGVLIDSVGVFVALLCFEWLVGKGAGEAFLNFLGRILAGLAVGVAGGLAIAWTLRHRIVPQNLQNGFALASALALLGFTEAVISDSGLLAVTVAGLVLGWKQPVGLRQVREFKAEITDLLIGLLFVLLAARLQLEPFSRFGESGLLIVALIIFLVRPLNVFISSHGSDLSLKEKIFLSWIAPRGIVAASMSSLFAISLAESNTLADPQFLETFTYSVIVATVVLQGSTAGLVARVLGLRRPDAVGWLIVGAHAMGRTIARFIRDHSKLEVVLLDTNHDNVEAASAEGLTAFCEDAMDTTLAEEKIEFQKLGNLLAVTDNAELNGLLCYNWGSQFGRDRVYRWCAGKGGRLESDLTHGRPIFPELPRPSVVSSELAKGMLELRSLEVDSSDAPVPGQVLLRARGGVIQPARPGVLDDLDSGDNVLVLGNPSSFGPGPTSRGPS